jgi:hypothetical protein
MSVAAILHLALHLLLPFALARWLWPRQWRRAGLVMLATMLVDLDHLLASPVFAPDRCSIGFHPLHRWPALLVYLLLWALPATRWPGLGLILHMALDASDCARQSWP